jgi:hypothetical protein
MEKALRELGVPEGMVTVEAEAVPENRLARTFQYKKSRKIVM